MTAFQDPFRPLTQRWEEAVKSLSRDSLTPVDQGTTDNIGFTDAIAANFRLGPTQRLARSSGIIDNLAGGLSVILPEWAGGVTTDQVDAIGPTAPEPFDSASYVKRLQPSAQQVAMRLLENGTFNDVTTRQDADAILNDAMSVQEDLDTLAAYNEREGFIKSMGAAVTGGLPDPIYLIPYGGQAAIGVMPLSSAARFFGAQGARALAIGGGINLATKKLVDETSYGLTDVPGATDELVAVGVGGGLAAVMPIAGYVARNGLASTVNALGGAGIKAPFGLPAWAQRWGSQEHLEAMFKKMNVDTVPLKQAATGEGADAALRELGGTIRYDLEADRSIKILDDLIADAKQKKFYPDLSIAPLMRGVDDPEVMTRVGQLQSLYKRHRSFLRKAGSSVDPEAYRISQQAHTAQDDFDRLRIVRAFFNEDPELQSLPANSLGRLFLDIGDKLPTGSTPGARASKYGNLMYDVTRALSGSFSDMTQQDMKLLGGMRASAEATKDQLDLMLASYNREMLAVMKKHGISSPIHGRLSEQNKALSEAVNVIFDRQAGVQSIPRNPAATELADVMERYFRTINDELVSSGLFDANPFGMNHYVHLSMDRKAMAADPAGAMSSLIEQFRFLDRAERPGQIRADALARAYDRTTDKAIKDEIVSTVRAHVGDPSFSPKNGTELRARLEDPSVSMLPPDTAFPRLSRTAYQDSLESVYREGADDLFKKLTDPFAETKMFESITTAGSPDSFKRRTFTSVSPALRPYLVTDPVALMRRYAAQVHGQIGIAKAIQSHPDIFGKMVLTEGNATRPVKNAQDLLSWLVSAGNAFETHFNNSGVKGTDAARNAVNGLIRDQQAIVKRLIGQALYEGGAKPSDGMMFWTRQLSRLALTVNGGMMGVSNLSDVASKLAWTVMHPVRGTHILFDTFAPIASQLRRRDLEFIHMTSQLSMLPREMTEYIVDQRGFGSGIVRRMTGKVDAATEQASRMFSRAIGLDFVNTFNGRWGAAIAMDEMVTLSKRLLVAMESGAPDPIKAARLSNTEIGRLSRLGIAPENVKRVLEQIHAHGVHWDQSPARAISFDEFLRSDRPVNPLFDQWTGALAERRTFQDTISNEARRVLNVTPGVADRPVMEDTAPLLRIVNQFSSYAFAYNRQRLRPMLQMGAGELSVHLGATAMLGWMMYATKNSLTNRRDFKDSVAELVNNPKAAVWGAMQDSMVLGNFMRTVGYYDRVAMQFGIPSTASATGQTISGGTFGAVNRQQQDRNVSGAEVVMSFAGAGPQLLTRLIDAAGERNAMRREYLMAQSIPFQNIVWARLLNKAGVSEKVKDAAGGHMIPGLVPSDAYRPQRPTMRAR